MIAVTPIQCADNRSSGSIQPIRLVVNPQMTDVFDNANDVISGSDDETTDIHDDTSVVCNFEDSVEKFVCRSEECTSVVVFDW